MATGKLIEVELDAVRITEKRFRDQEEERQYQLSKKEADSPKPKVEESVPVSEKVKITEDSTPVKDQKGTKQ